MYSGIHYILSPILNIPVLDMYSKHIMYEYLRIY